MLALALLASGCAAKTDACLLPGQQRMLLLSLYFGRNVAGRGPVTDAEWARFATDVLGRQFPDGFTVFDATGQWRSPATGLVAREATKVVQVALPAGADPRGKVEGVSAAYRDAFRQDAVGVVSYSVCGAF